MLLSNSFQRDFKLQCEMDSLLDSECFVMLVFLQFVLYFVRSDINVGHVVGFFTSCSLLKLYNYC